MASLFCAPGGATAEHSLRQLRPRAGGTPSDIKPKNRENEIDAPVWEKRFVADDSSRRRLLNSGDLFVVNQDPSQGVDWCMDAVNGINPSSRLEEWDGIGFPSLGFRPCAYNAGPSEQLFYMDDDGRILSKLGFYETEICLMVEDGLKAAESGDRIRIGSGEDICSRFGARFLYGHDYNEVGRIKAAGNPDLCLAFEGMNPDDDDRILLVDCAGDSSPHLQWMFRTGWYELYAGDNLCVAVRDQVMESGNRVVLDNCSKAGFSRHWRIDGNGLFHNRLDDGYCMEAEQTRRNGRNRMEAGAAIRIRPCDENEPNQQFEWPQGFEASINLKSNPDLRLVVQGATDEEGDPMVLQKKSLEWSGDSVHI